jgi:seryl-tRNA(Sec) selenium transferase
MPGKELDTVVVQWRPSSASVDDTTAELREAEVPVIVRIRDDAICFDLRTLPESHFDDLIDAVYAAMYGDPCEDDESDEEPRDGVPLPVI